MSDIATEPRHHGLDYDLADEVHANTSARMKALGDPLRMTILDLVLEQSMTVTQLAERLRRPKGSVAYHVKVLVAAGLLQVVRTQKVRAIEERFENDAVLECLRRRLERRRAGEAGDPRAHITQAAEPVAPATLRFNRAAEIWAALSISALLIGLAVLILASPSNVWAELVVLLIAFLAGGAGGYSRWGAAGLSPAALIGIILLILLVTGRL